MRKDLSKSAEERKAELVFLESKGIDAYPGQIPPRTHLNLEVRAQFNQLENKEVSVVGRMTSVRDHGKIVFVDLEDGSGKVQASLSIDGVGENMFDTFKQGFSAGDFVGFTGSVIKTKAGEVTIKAKNVSMLAKALLQAPSKLDDVETRSRERWLDMLVNKEVRERFIFRSQMVQFMRERFMSLDCLEVETPVLDNTYGGASARPFETHHNALDTKLFLRISNELYLKRFLIGGIEGVFEFSRDFRNEGMDRIHNPEFTQVELYKAYTDYNWMMCMAENLIADMSKKLKGTTTIEYQGKKIDLSAPWKRLTVYDGVKEALGVDPETISDKELLKIAKQHGIKETDRGYIFVELFGKFVEPKLINPTFVIDFPASTSPLTKKHRTKAGLTERFECVINGMEVMNCYTELNDPRTQRKNFDEEFRRRQEGDAEAMLTDEDFIKAMEHGMPPQGGIGISIDRWAMILANVDHIREVISFPTMKPLASPKR